jgi:cadmium resistance protein CadD (predicted permease)
MVAITLEFIRLRLPSARQTKIAVIALIFVVMTALWCFLAHATVNHPKLGSPIRRYGHRVAPIVLIGLGMLILYQAGSLGLLRHGGF